MAERVKKECQNDRIGCGECAVREMRGGVLHCEGACSSASMSKRRVRVPSPYGGYIEISESAFAVMGN